MKKNRIAWLLVLAALLLSLAAAFALAEDAEDPVLAHTADDSIVLRKSDLQGDYDETLAYLLTQYSQQGYQMDEYDTEFQAYAA